jgi:glycosyltransferase involved in cell wall biosynthesis
MPKIALVLTARFPSEKAYAVTTLETARAAESMGIPAEIYAPFDSKSEIVSNVTYVENKIIRKLAPLLGRVPGRLGAYIFLTRRILIAAEFRKISRATNYPNLIVWTRDPIVAIMTNNETRVFLELHNKPSLVDGLICKLLDRKRKFSVGTLTATHQDQLREYFSKAKISILPMAVSSTFFLPSRSEIEDETIGYVGKGWSSGEDNKLYELISSAKLVDDEAKAPIHWEFLGLEPNYMSKMESEVGRYSWINSTFDFINHVSHDKVPKYLGAMSIGLIPYHDSIYNRQRFPIKALEYAAAGVTILATDTPGNHSVMKSDFCYFYVPEDVTSLAKIILLILNEKKERNQKRENARRWAKTHSYEARVEIVLGVFDSSNERSSNA